MSYQEAYQEPYTKYPNRYNDIIKPRLTGTQRDICDVVIRMTYGWHKTTAEISNTVFARKANKSKQGIIKGKKQLEEMGILIVLGKGGGSKTNEYMLDLWYDNPDKSVKASMLRQEEELLEIENPLPEKEQENIPELLEAQTTVEPQMGIEEHVDCDVPEPPAVELENPTPEEENSEQENPDTDSAEKPVKIEDSAPPTSKLSLPPYIGKEDLSINTKEKKQTEKEPKKAIATVRFQFLSFFPEAKADDDWQFFGWVAKEYGLEACLAKLDFMKEHRKQHNITNPKGFFRTALVKDFQPPAFIATKLKADEAAKREKIRCQKEIQDRRQKFAEFNYGSAMAACQKIMDMLG